MPPEEQHELAICSRSDLFAYRRPLGVSEGKVLETPRGEVASTDRLRQVALGADWSAPTVFIAAANTPVISDVAVAICCKFCSTMSRT